MALTAEKFSQGRTPQEYIKQMKVNKQPFEEIYRSIEIPGDVQGFFDAISHEWLVKFVEHRIGDRRVVRLIQKWLNAGVLEKGKRTQVDKGTPQGGSISPLLANIYLHYVFDLWAQVWRRKQAKGDVVIVRYADDLVVGFQHRPVGLSWGLLRSVLRPTSLRD